MLPAVAAAALIVAASLTVGQALLTLCGRPDDRVVAGPVGLALLLAVAATVAGLGGRGAATAIALCVLTAVSAAVLLRSGLPQVPREARIAPILAALLAGLFAALPFIAAGHVGILGVGLVNDDMASHLLLADWIAERFDPEPVLIDQGYPLGPHALVAGLGSLLGARTIDVFAGLVLAIPALTAFMAAGALSNLRPLSRVACSALVALPYLAAAYLAQEAFKEPIVALFLLGFALLLATTRDWRGAIALGVIAAGTVYVYSFPGLTWLALTTLIWVAFVVIREARAGAARGLGRGAREDRRGESVEGAREHRRRGLRSMDARWVRCMDAELRRSAVIPALLAAAGVLLLLTALDFDRLRDFADFRALDPDRANEGGLGNLRGHLSPLEAFGIWPTSEFRLSAGEGSGPAALFYAGAVLGAAALVVGLPGWIRRHGPAVPAALAAAALIYVGARGFGTVYSSGKALAIAAPLVAVIALGAMTETGARRALAVVFAVGVTFSSFLVLRQAPVAPEDHMDELAEIRPIVEGEKVLFLGRDNFVLWELRGSKPFTHVRNFYDPYFVEPNFDLREVGSKFDFDSVTAETLARFPYVITTRAAYASGPSPDYEAVVKTSSYVLWEKQGPVAGRVPVEDGPEPGAVLECDLRRNGVAAVLPEKPLLVPAADWSSTTVESGSEATLELQVPPGVWQVSVQYDSTRPLTVSALGDETKLPGNLDYRGTGPFWAAGEIAVESREPFTLTASVEDPPLAGRAIGADSVAHLGALALTGGEERLVGDRAACGEYADWLLRR